MIGQKMGGPKKLIKQIGLDYGNLLILLVGCLSFYPNVLRADTVELRSGVIFADVKAEPLGKSHRIRFGSGRVRMVANSAIHSVRPSPVRWNHPLVVRLVTQMVSPPGQPTVPPENPSSESSTKIGINWGPILKSAILPGWGQYSVGRKWTGALYSTLTIYALERYWELRQKHATAQDEYNDPIPVSMVSYQAMIGAITIPQAGAINLAYLSQKEREVNKLETEGNNMVALLAFVWGWNMVDIAFGKSIWEKVFPGSGPGNQKIGFGVLVQRNSIMAGVRISL